MEIIAIPLIIFLLMIFVTSFFFTMKKRLVGCLMLIILIAGSAALGYMLITGVITLPIYNTVPDSDALLAKSGVSYIFQYV